MRIALIDFSNIFRIRWHASEGDETSSVVRKTVQEITGYASDYDRVAICVDSPPYRRSEISADYKAHREAAPRVMYEMMRRVTDELGGDGYPIVGSEGYEADDIIATLCREFSEHEIDIYSADKDLMQLVTETTRCISTMTRTTYDGAKVLEKFGVEPAKIAELLALTGDKSDNVPGVAGVGVKTAAKWLNSYGCLQGIIEASGMGKLNKAGNNIDAAVLGLSHKLVTLESDAPIDVAPVIAEREPKEMKMQEPEGVQDGPGDDASPDSPKNNEPIEKTEALAVRKSAPVAPADWDRGLEPQNLVEAKWLAQDMFDSRLFGDFPNPQAILAAVMTGRDLGMSATAALRAIYIVKGKPCLASATMVALVRKRRDLCEYFDIIESTSELCTIETLRVGSKNPTRMTFTIADARRAGLDRSQTYQKFPSTMLRHRCESEICRAVYPDAILGLYTVEEMESV